MARARSPRPSSTKPSTCWRWRIPTAATDGVRIRVRVHPGSSQQAVGGRYGETGEPILVVRVRERAVDGKANEAVRRALADAFGLRRADVRIISGASTRTKLVAMVSADPGRLEELLTDRC